VTRARPNDELLRYARQYAYVVFTHDLDFGALLARWRPVKRSELAPG
jgi:predicted nuclease of predicted toxin-antitoxin system